MALDSKGFSNEFNVGAYCVHKDNQAKLYVRISNFEIIMTKAFQKNLQKNFLNSPTNMESIWKIGLY